MKIEHTKTDRAQVRVDFREHFKLAVSTLVGVFVGTLWSVQHRKASTFVGICADIFVDTPVCVFVSTFVGVRGSNLRFACSVFSDLTWPF